MSTELPRRRQPARTRRMAEPLPTDDASTPPAEETTPEAKGETVERIPTRAAEPTPPAPAPAPAPEPAAEPAAPAAVAPGNTHPRTMREMLARVDDGWRHFRVAAGAFPSERMDEHLGDGGWTRKQMLAHIAAWHEVTADRLGRMLVTGRAADLNDDTDAFNARVARQAVGRTAGEVIQEMEMTFNRLRRRLAQLTDEHLGLDDGWAAQVIAGNTYEHYDEHRADVYAAMPSDGRSGRR